MSFEELFLKDLQRSGTEYEEKLKKGLEKFAWLAMAQQINNLQSLVEAQASNPTLWANATTALEADLQANLRALHGLVGGKTCA